MGTEADVEIARRAPPALLLPQPRQSGWGLAASLGIHAALVLLIVGGVIGGAERLLVGGGSGAGPAGGSGGGGGRVSYIELPVVGGPAAAAAAEAPVVVTPPVEAIPIVTAVPPPETTVAVAAPAAGRADSANASGSGASSGTGPGSGGGIGGGALGGQGTGTGPGSGPGTGGDSTDIAPPQLRNWVPPMERPPKELRGRTIRVTFWVSVDGRVDKFETDPEIRDRDYLEKFSEIVMKTRFRPARTRAGAPVAVVFPMDFILSTGS